MAPGAVKAGKTAFVCVPFWGPVEHYALRSMREGCEGIGGCCVWR